MPPPSPAWICAAAAHAVFAIVSLRLILVDLRRRRLPNRTVGWGSGAVLALLLASAWAGGSWRPLTTAVVSALAYGAAFLALWLLSPGALGAGDVKLAPLVGLVAGWSGVSTAGVWVPLALALLSGIAGLVARARGRRSLGFGPVMLAACWAGVGLAGVGLTG